MAINFPASPADGDVYLGYYWDDAKGAWRSQQINSSSVITSPTTPTGATAGDLWFNNNDGTLYVYYNDGISTYWTEIKANSALTTTLDDRISSLESSRTSLIAGTQQIPGSVVQIKRGYQNSFVTANSTGYTATGLKVQITPKFASSYFYVSASGALNSRPAGYGAGIVLYARNVTTSGSMAQWSLDAGNVINGGYMYANADSDQWGQAYAQGYKPGPSYTVGQTIEFEVYVAAIGPGTDNSTQIRWGHDTFQNDIVVMEVAQ